MQFDQLEVENFKSISQESVNFGNGILVMHGENGAGKSSFLEAAFFALYGSNALPSHSNLNDIIKTGETYLRVMLRFRHGGEDYLIERELIDRGNGSPDHECVFETKDDIINGVTASEHAVETLLNMDADSFLNCAYVRQGEIELVDATPAEREEMIDRLLHLGMFETYTDRANKVRLGVKNLREEREALLNDVKTDIDNLEEQDLETQRSAIISEIDRLETKRSSKKDELESREQEKQEAEDAIERLSKTKDRIEELNGELTEAKEKLETSREKRQKHHKEFKKQKKRRNEIIDSLNTSLPHLEIGLKAAESLQNPTGMYDVDNVENKRESLQKRSKEVSEEAMDKRSKKKSLENDIEDLREWAEQKESNADKKDKKVASVRSEKSDLVDRKEGVETEIESVRQDIKEQKREFESEDFDFGNAVSQRERVEEKLESIQSERNDIEKELSTAEDQLEQADELLDEGKCPECGQDVDGSPHVESIEEYRDRVNDLQSKLSRVKSSEQDTESRLQEVDRLVSIEESVDSMESTITQKQREKTDISERIAEKKDRINDLQIEAKDLRETSESHLEDANQKVEMVNNLDEEISKLEDKRYTIDDQIDDFDSVIEDISTLNSTISEIDHAREKRDGLDEVIEDREETVDDLAEELTECSDEYDEKQLEQKQEAVEEACEGISSLKVDIEQIEDTLNQKRGEKGRVEEKQSTLKRKKEKRDTLIQEVDRLEDAEEQTEDVQFMYSSLREELREKNVTKLEQLFNEVFMDLYQNDTYERIAITNNYEITIYDKRQGELSPKMLSGGEKVMFNLALRCAIYQLLAEAGEGNNARDTLPPLILDEPTAHLDNSHVTQLTEVVKLMRELGVDQTIVVSHQEEVVATSDMSYRVRLNTTTNSSTIETATSVW